MSFLSPFPSVLKAGDEVLICHDSLFVSSPFSCCAIGATQMSSRILRLMWPHHSSVILQAVQAIPSYVCDAHLFPLRRETEPFSMGP